MSVVSKLQIVLEATTTAFDRGLRSAQRSLDGFARRTQDLHERMDRFARNNEEALQGLQTAGAAAAVGLGAIAVGIQGAVQEAMRFEDAMADVKKVIDFDSPQGIKDFRAELEKMSGQLPIAFDGLAKIAAAAGQSGVAKEDILRFTEAAAKMGVAFDISADEAGQAMAEMRVAFKMNQSEVETLADKINFLGNTTPNTAKKILEVVQRIGSLGGIAGVSSDQITALAGSITAVEPDVAATGIKNMMLAMTAGEGATKSQKEAFDSLGLSAERLAKNMQMDSMGTFLDLLERIKKMPKELQVATINDIFGSEALPIIAQYVDNLDVLKNNLKAMGDVSKYAGSMNAEYDSRAATLSNTLAILSNKIQIAKASIGEAFAPSIGELANKIAPIVDKIATWAKENPILITTITAVTAGVLGLVTVLGGLALAFTAVTSGLGSIIAIGGMISGFFAVISNGVGLIGMFGGALAALGFPVTAVVAGITAIVAGGVLLWQNWDMVKAKAIEMWHALPQLANEAWLAVQSVWGGVVLWFGGIWDNTKRSFMTWLGSMPQPVQEMVANIGTIFGTLVSVAQTVWGSIVATAKWVSDGIMSTWQGLVGMVSTIWGEIKSVITAVIDSLTPIAKVGFEIFSSIATAQFTAIKTAVSVVFEAIKAFLSAWLGSTKAIFTAGITVFASVFNSGFSLIKNTFTTIFNAIKALVRGDMQGVATAIRAGLSNAVSIVRTMITNIVGAFKNLGSQLLQAGRDAIQGFINGVRQKMGEALATAWQMANQVASAVKSALDIHSPSRVMKKLGKHTAEGLAEGIKKDTPKAVKAAKKMAEDVKKAVADGVANLKREIALFNDDSLIAALKYDIDIGKYKGANTAELEALTAQKYALERNKVAYDEIASIQRELTTAGMNALQVLEWEIKNTHKYKDISADVLDKLKEQTAQKVAQLDLQDKLNKSMQANERSQVNYAGLQKQIALFSNQSKLAEFDYDWQNGAFSGADNMLLLRERAKIAELENLQNADKAKTAFDGLQTELAGELSPLEKLQKQYDDRLVVIRNFENTHTDVVMQAQNARNQAQLAFETAKTDLILSQNEQMFGTLAGLTKSFAGENSKAYRTIFAIEKGMALARIILANKTALAQAWASAPFPANLGAVAKVALESGALVSAVNTIKPVIGQAHDGIMSVPKSGTWNLEKGERVLPKHTAQNLDRTLANLQDKRQSETKIIINNYTGEKTDVQQMPNGDFMVTIGKMMQQVARHELAEHHRRSKRQGWDR